MPEKYLDFDDRGYPYCQNCGKVSPVKSEQTARYPTFYCNSNCAQAHMSKKTLQFDDRGHPYCQNCGKVSPIKSEQMTRYYCNRDCARAHQSPAVVRLEVSHESAEAGQKATGADAPMMLGGIPVHLGLIETPGKTVPLGQLPNVQPPWIHGLLRVEQLPVAGEPGHSRGYSNAVSPVCS